MGLLTRLKTVTSGVIKAKLTGDDAETDLDALTAAELEADLERPTRVRTVLAGAKPAVKLPEPPSVDASAPVVRGPAGKRSL